MNTVAVNTVHRSIARTAGALVIAFAIVLPTASFAGKADDTLNVAFDRELESLDNYVNTAREGILISRMVWDGLLYRDPQTNEYLGNLATSYQWINDTTLEFELRQGASFHNGEPFNADDVVFTVNWAADPANGVTTQRNVNWMKSAEKLDDYKVRLHLHAPFPAALEYLSGPVVIYPNEYYSEAGPQGMGVKPVGTGPYKVTEVEAGKRYKLEKYDGYHDGSPKGQPSIGTIVIRTLPERNTQIAELMAGQLDWIWKVPPDQAERLDQMGRFTVKNAETMRVGYLTMDAAGRSGETPFADLKVRQALAHAIDRQGIVDGLVKGESQVVDAACFPSQVGCTKEVTRYDYDPAKAKQLLSEAGYPDGFTTPLLAYRDRDYAEAIINNLNAVGISTEFQYLKYAAARDKIQAGDVPLAFMTWGSYSINDASAITSHFFKFEADDMARDEQVRDWLATADSSTDLKVRQEHYGKALARIAEQAYWLPLWSYNTNYVFSQELQFEPTPDEIPRFFTMSWK